VDADDDGAVVWQIASVDKHIAYIEEVRPVATSRDVPGHSGARYLS
jgi:hypothetical protein